jgi:hypothetical protein
MMIVRIRRTANTPPRAGRWCFDFATRGKEGTYQMQRIELELDLLLQISSRVVSKVYVVSGAHRLHPGDQLWVGPSCSAL